MKRVFTDVGNARALFLQTLEIGVLALALLAPMPARAEGFEAYVRVERFLWDEFAEGARLLEEDGLRLGGGFLGVLEDFDHWGLALRIEGAAGQVDYDGQTFGGDPVTATTDYVGFRMDLDGLIGPRPDGAFAVRGIAGIGSRYWIRRLAEGRAEEGGYDEFWWTVYGRLGFLMEWKPRPGLVVFLRAAARPPIHNRLGLNIDLVDSGEFTLEPGGEWTTDAEAGIRAGEWTFSVFYETLSFAESPIRVFPPIEVFQPRSEGEIAGVQAGLAW